MPNIGPLEIAIVIIIALVIFGPKRLPELGRSLGSGMRQFKTSVAGEADEEGRARLNGGPDSTDRVQASDGDATAPSTATGGTAS